MTLIRILYYDNILAAQEPNVTGLYSSVRAAGRTFACENEEVVYRCVTRNGNPSLFSTEWNWSGERIASFNSNQTVGGSGTCIKPNNESLNFLHLTLISANSTTYTCVSLLIVTPSLVVGKRYIDLNERDIIVKCSAFDDRTSLLSRNNMTMNHSISGEYF